MLPNKRVKTFNNNLHVWVVIGVYGNKCRVVLLTGRINSLATGWLFGFLSRCVRSDTTRNHQMFPQDLLSLCVSVFELVFPFGFPLNSGLVLTAFAHALPSPVSMGAAVEQPSSLFSTWTWMSSWAVHNASLRGYWLSGFQETLGVVYFRSR